MAILPGVAEPDQGRAYVLERRIAGGGMGAIWVALKLMMPERIASSPARHQSGC